ncbi:MAG TPA: hypothetical protein VGI74_18910 [Streptosporangiaceae bacterium]|jgi:hypothetical protein
MRRPLPSDDQVKSVMACVLTQAAENGCKATVTAVEQALSIPHATFDRHYRHLINDFPPAGTRPIQHSEANQGSYQWQRP